MNGVLCTRIYGMCPQARMQIAIALEYVLHTYVSESKTIIVLCRNKCIEVLMYVCLYEILL